MGWCFSVFRRLLTRVSRWINISHISIQVLQLEINTQSSFLGYKNSINGKSLVWKEQSSNWFIWLKLCYFLKVEHLKLTILIQENLLWFTKFCTVSLTFKASFKRQLKIDQITIAELTSFWFWVKKENFGFLILLLLQLIKKSLTKTRIYFYLLICSISNLQQKKQGSCAQHPSGLPWFLNICRCSRVV